MLVFAKRRLKARISGSPWKPSNHKLKAIFVHIPKNGGISIESSLFGEKIGHNPLHQYEEWNKCAFNNYFKFTVVRNPLDRLVSAYFFLKDGGRNKHDMAWADKWLGRSQTFDMFCDRLGNDKGYRNQVLNWQHFRPQVSYMKDLRGRINFNYIARLERLDTDFEYIQQQLSVTGTIEHKNRSQRDPDWKKYFSIETASVAAGIYNADISQLGYERETAALLSNG